MTLWFNTQWIPRFAGCSYANFNYGHLVWKLSLKSKYSPYISTASSVAHSFPDDQAQNIHPSKSNIIMKWQRFPCINALRGYVLICTVCVCAHIICCDNNVKQRRILFYVNWYLQHYCWGSRLKMVIVLLTYAYTWLIAYRCNPRRIITQATATAAILASVKCLSCLNKKWCNYHLSVTLSTSDYRAQIQKSCRQIWYIPTTSPMGILY